MIDVLILIVVGSINFWVGYYMGTREEKVQYEIVKPISFDTPFNVWIAYCSDWSEMVVFKNELDCLRYATENYMSAKNVIDCESIRHGTIEAQRV